MSDEEIVHGEVLPAVTAVVGVPQADLQRLARELGEAQRIGTTLAEDLESALNIVRRLHVALESLSMPNPCIVEVNRLLRKYRMPTLGATKGFQVFADGKDITEHPDSIEGSVAEYEEIPAVTTLELVGDEDGNMGFIGQRSELPPRQEEPEDAEVVEIDDPTGESRDWLQDVPTVPATGYARRDESDPGPSWEEPRLATREEIEAATEHKQVGAFARRPVNNAAQD